MHSLTALNGREQPVLGSLALSSPRTTATQEGLATFAEQITGNIDIERMKRVSLRIEAIAMALDGADFIEVFRYFLDAGQIGRRKLRLGAARVPRRAADRRPRLHQGRGVPARPDRRAHLLPLGAAAGQAAAVPACCSPAR